MHGNPQVEVVWAKVDGTEQERVKDKAAVEEDQAIQQWFRDDNSIVSQIIAPGAGHIFSLYKIQPEKVEAAQGLVPYMVLAVPGKRKGQGPVKVVILAAVRPDVCPESQRNAQFHPATPS